MSKVSQKSEVLNLRYINVCQYCKYYLKYWSKGINGPLDPWGGQNFQCFIKWDGLTGHGGVCWRAQINFLSKTSILNPSVHPPRVQWDIDYWSKVLHFSLHNVDSNLQHSSDTSGSPFDPKHENCGWPGQQFRGTRAEIWKFQTTEKRNQHKAKIHSTMTNNFNPWEKSPVLSIG